jgi:hypothetical protein
MNWPATSKRSEIWSGGLYVTPDRCLDENARAAVASDPRDAFGLRRRAEGRVTGILMGLEGGDPVTEMKWSSRDQRRRSSRSITVS